MELHRFAPCDLPGMYRVCLLTGDAGSDATGLYRDPDLLGQLYAGAYPTADPGLTWAVRDGLGVAGYIVATDDSARFAQWQERFWWPDLRERYPLRQADDPAADHQSVDVRAVQTIHTGQEPSVEVLDLFPAHLHIDLLPRAQGLGWGRRLIDTLAGELRTRGVPGVHLGVACENTGAIAFYQKVGFSLLQHHDWGLTLGLGLRE